MASAPSGICVILSATAGFAPGLAALTSQRRHRQWDAVAAQAYAQRDAVSARVAAYR